MKKALEDYKVFAVELICLILGLFWAKSTNWDWEPIILIVVSGIGIAVFIALKFSHDNDERPIVDLEFVECGTYRSAPTPIREVSPMTLERDAFVIKQGGIYAFTLHKDYKLIIRNNSRNNAYNLKLFRDRDNYPLVYESTYNPLEALTIDKPFEVNLKYHVHRGMTRDEAEEIIKSNVPKDLQHFHIIAEYRGEGKKLFYTKFIPLRQNEHLNKKPDLTTYSLIS